MIPNFLKEERAKRVVIRVIDRPKYLPLSDAETEVLELAFPFAETSLQQDTTFSMQFATIEGEVAQAGKEGHGAEMQLGNHARQRSRLERWNSWLSISGWTE